jgi:hypothetical protein
VETAREFIGRHLAGHDFDELGRVVLCHSWQADALQAAVGVPAGQSAERLGAGVLRGHVDVVVRAQQQQPVPFEIGREVLQQGYRRPVRPVQVVQDHGQGVGAANALQERGDRVEQPELGFVRGVFWTGGFEIGQFFTDLGDDPGDQRGGDSQLRAQPARLALLDVSADSLRPRPEGRYAPALAASPHRTVIPRSPAAEASS